MSINLCSVGDIMLGENVHHFGRGIIKKFSSDYTRLLSPKVYEVISEADILIFNMESGFAPDIHFLKRNISNGVYLAPESAATIFRKINAIKIANVANNHFSQHGVQSAGHSLQFLEKEGILVAGRDNTPLVIEMNSKVLKIWGVSLIDDKNYCGQYFRSSNNNLIRDLNLSRKADNEIRIISIHWGDEYLTLENAQQQILAQELSDAGFDFILGHHPHVIQSVVRLNKTWTVFSHGNFIFDQNFSKLTQTGLIFNANLSDNHPKLLFSHQKMFQVKELRATSPEALNHYCKKHFHPRKPFFMRIRMKVELIVHFYELNRSVIVVFMKRLLRKSSSRHNGEN
ncbi:bacterial capsule synthesis protein PGA_cap [Lentimicrobium saccharophilum]|uniref:Bacterial capsule synthesis protein PGA_cap n=1 Tax=Lentimicrobium saccharophilum TaxID=1678841 RepID=A0A0S7BVQ8_9BACT|nr:CapA family protein [Lentimicrobium saccharophilum]GAP45045.1 bacterial capsule synthesis protein PGA_cap [Lentimicrobium saccharophilum]